MHSDIQVKNMKHSDYNKETATAYLSSQSGMTSFRYGEENIRFRTSDKLECYTSIKEWNNGYLVVMAKYSTMGEVEEYIDLLPILQNLYINPEKFLKPIKNVKINYDSRQ